MYRTLLHQDSITLQNADIPSAIVPPNQAILYRALLHQDSMTYLQNALVPSADCPPANHAHIYRALLHQDSMTYYRMCWYLVPIDDSPLIEPTSTEPYYTRTVWSITDVLVPSANWLLPPANQAQVYIALQHQDSMT